MEGERQMLNNQFVKGIMTLWSAHLLQILYVTVYPCVIPSTATNMHGKS